MTVDSSKFFRRIVPILIGLLLLVRALGMAQVPLMDSTEARYGEIGRKIAELNDWVTPWFDYGTPYWGKPPLAFWLTAISFNLFGVSEFTARLPHFLVSLITGFRGNTPFVIVYEAPEFIWGMLPESPARPSGGNHEIGQIRRSFRRVGRRIGRCRVGLGWR